MQIPPGGRAVPIVEALDVRRVYETGKVRVNALNGVSLSVAAGEMIAIMGPSGSGKSTLLNCLSGLDSITAGDVLIDGTSLASMSDRERTDYRARHRGFVFQFYSLMPVLTAVENVELPLLVGRVPMRRACERLEARFLENGMEAESIRKLLDEAVGASRTFNLIIQGFMGLGLVIGVAALGVIAARSVVERRQQIGVLRAIGFRRGMIQLALVLESSFLALSAIAVGSALGLILAYNVISDSAQDSTVDNLQFTVPWLNPAVIFLAVYVASLLATMASARRASRVYPAEALRYQ